MADKVRNMFLESSELLPQICGAIALFLGILAYQFKKGKTMLGMQAAMSIFWLVHFAMIGAHVGALMSCVGFCRNSTACFINKKHLPKVAIIASIASLGLGLYAAEAWIYLAACAGSVLNTLSILARENPFIFRLIQFAGEGMWLLYSIIVFSWPGIAFGLFLIISNTIGTFRHEKESIVNSLQSKPDRSASQP